MANKKIQNRNIRMINALVKQNKEFKEWWTIFRKKGPNPESAAKDFVEEVWCDLDKAGYDDCVIKRALEEPDPYREADRAQKQLENLKKALENHKIDFESELGVLFSLCALRFKDANSALEKLYDIWNELFREDRLKTGDGRLSRIRLELTFQKFTLDIVDTIDIEKRDVFIMNPFTTKRMRNELAKIENKMKQLKGKVKNEKFGDLIAYAALSFEIEKEDDSVKCAKELDELVGAMLQHKIKEREINEFLTSNDPLLWGTISIIAAKKRGGGI